MNILTLEKAGAFLAIVFAMRVYSKWKVDRRERAEGATPLVDPVLIETVFAPRSADGDDADVLLEVRNTILHLNRRAYAEEFWGLHTQLTAWHNQLPRPDQQATFRRALLRLLATSDRWLQVVAAKTCAALGIREAAAQLRTLLDNLADTDDAADVRYKEEITAALQAVDAK